MLGFSAFSLAVICLCEHTYVNIEIFEMPTNTTNFACYKLNMA